MRHTINYIAALLVLSLSLLSCSRETGLKMDEGAGNTVRFTIESSLRAVGDENTTRPTPALERERKIVDLYAVVYKTSSGLHYKTIKCTDKGSGQYEFDNEKSGDFYFFLIANPDADLAAKLMAGPTTPEDLGMLVAKQTPGEDNQATNFLMTSERQNVTVKSKESTNIGTIKLVRVAARFDIYNTIEGLEIQKVTFGKRRVQSHLFAQVGKMDGIEATENAKVYDGSLFKDKTLAATIYGYETDVRNETFFTIEATYKGKPLKPETVRLENFVIKRNHLYNIILHDVGGAHSPADEDKKFGQFQYQVKVIDWNDSEKGINYAEDDVLKPFYVDYAVQISNAPYMTPYLVNSPEEIYTTTQGESVITFTIGGYTEPGTLELAEGQETHGATLEKVGTPTTDPKTGKISQDYKLTIPAATELIPLVNQAGKPTLPEYQEIKLVAKNYSGATKKPLTIKHGRFKMPLEYVTEHYLAPHPDAANGENFTFATDETSVDGVGYFHVPTFLEKHKHVTIDGKGYHLPDFVYELASIMPLRNQVTHGVTEYSVGESAGSIENAGEPTTFPCWAYSDNGKSPLFFFTADYRTDKANHVSYGLRHKRVSDDFNNMFVTAYRYEWVGDFKGDKTGKISSYYKITARYLGPNWNGGVDGIANEAFWNSNKENDVTRTFYAAGYVNHMYLHTQNNPNSPYTHVGEWALIITNKCDIDRDYVVCGVLEKIKATGSAGMYTHSSDPRPEQGIWYPVRLFSDK